MFNHVGSKIQKISAYIFTVEAIAGLLIGIAVWVVLSGRNSSPGETIAGFLVGAVVAGIFTLLAWLSQLLLQAYGKITEYCETELEKNVTEQE